MCAERNAIAIALSRGYRRENFRGIAVSIGEDRQANCCGACRQFISEVDNDKFWVVVLGDKPIAEPKPLCVRLSSLLPGCGADGAHSSGGAANATLHRLDSFGPKWNTSALLAEADKVEENK